jgi:enamine deaminase RidA (YjgF/YER057c/UK114 family)
MSRTISEKLQLLGYTLPAASAPAANYVPVVRAGNLLFISGQVSALNDTQAVFGIVGANLSVEDGRRGAELAALKLLAQIASATDGTILAVRRIVRLGVYIASTPELDQHSQVANGASDLLLAVFGDHAGSHSRTAVGMSSLPRGAAVEIDAIVELEPAV